jgi:hypothetical protein
MGNETKGEIHAAMVKVMASVGVVAKTRRNAAQGYQFRGIDDVQAACQGPLAEHGVLCVPRVVKEDRETVATKSGGTMVSVRLTVDHYFTARDGSWVICTTIGEAMDSGDKATNKAMSAAMKYALVLSLCIPTHEDDRDTESASPELAPKAPPPRPAASRTTDAPARQTAQAPRPATSGGATLPNYGSLKGQPVAGQKVKDLEFYAGGCRKSLGDPAKERWHDKERQLLAAIEAEIAAQAGQRDNHEAATGYPDDGPPPHTDSDAF